MRIKHIQSVIHQSAIATLAMLKNNMLVSAKGDPTLQSYVDSAIDVTQVAKLIAGNTAQVLQLIAETGDEITLDIVHGTEELHVPSHLYIPSLSENSLCICGRAPDDPAHKV